MNNEKMHDEKLERAEAAARDAEVGGMHDDAKVSRRVLFKMDVRYA